MGCQEILVLFPYFTLVSSGAPAEREGGGEIQG